MDKIIIGSYRGHKYNNDGWIYVALSRVACLEDLFTMEPLDEKLSKYRQRRNVKKENDRLMALSNELSKRFKMFTMF